jgi:hypothetical protein
MNKSLRFSMRYCLPPLLAGALVLSGCVAPQALTVGADGSYKEKVSALDIVLILPTELAFTTLPKQDGAFRTKYTHGQEWLRETADILEKNFTHNGIKATARAGVFSPGDSDYWNTRGLVAEHRMMLRLTKATYQTTYGVRARSPSAVVFEATLLRAGRAEPVWTGEAAASTHQAGDVLSLKLLKALKDRSLFVPTTGQPETTGGLRSVTFGGVLTP